MERTSDLSCRVLVSNIPENISEDYFVNFFECKITNSPVSSYQQHSTQQNAFILQFETAVDVADLQEKCKENPLKEQVLLAQPFHEQAGDEVCSQFSTQAVVSCIPDKVTNDYLTNWLECNFNEEYGVHRIQRGSKQGVALVTFDKSIDLGKLQKKCSNTMLEDRCLEIKPVDARGAILIHNPHPDTDTNSFRFYFCNTRRSGGSNVVHIERDEHDKFLIVYFESRDVAERVAQKEHSLENTELQLKLFCPDLDVAADDAALSADKNESHTNSSSQPAPQALGCIADVNSSSQPAPHALGCIADTASTGDGQMAESANSSFHDSGDMHTLSKALEDVKLKAEEFEACVEGLPYVYLKLVDTFSDSISNLGSNVQVSVEKETRIKLKGDKDVVIRMDKMFTSLCHKQRSSKYLKEVAEKFRGWDEVFEESIENTKKYFMEFKQESPVDDNTQMEEIYIGISESQSKLMSFDQFLEMFVKMDTIAVGNEVADELVSSEAWDEFIENDIEEKYGKKIQIDCDVSSRKIWVRGSVEHLESAVSLVRQFLQDTVVHHTIELNSKQEQFLSTYCLETLESLKCETGLGCAQIKIEGKYCQIQGLGMGVRKAVKKIEEILENFKCKRAIFTHPNLQSIPDKMLESMKSSVAQKYRCIISELPDLEILDSDDGDRDWGQWRATIIQSFGDWTGQAKCHVVEGKVEDMKVDAIVVFHQLQNTGGGRPLTVPPSAQGKGARPKHFPSSTRGNQSVTQTRGAIVEPSGALPCKALISVNLSDYFQCDGSYENGLQCLMADLMRLSEGYHFRSLALPLLGKDVPIASITVPVDVAAKAFTQAFKKCCNDTFSVPHEHGHLHRSRELQSLRDVFVCSPRAACVHGLIHALEAEGLQSVPLPDNCRYVSCSSESVGGKCLENKIIRVTTGDISRVKADVLVVPLDIDIDLDLNKSKITRYILQQGGRDVERTLQHGRGWLNSSEIHERNEELAKCRVISGEPGNLPARRIYYVYLPPWGPGVLEMLPRIVQRCLWEASNEKFKSVAIPVLGVGKLDYPLNFTARASIAAVSDFMENQKTTVENVKFVIFRNDASTFRAFNQEHYQWFKQRMLGDYGNLQDSSVDPHSPSEHTFKTQRKTSAASTISLGTEHKGRSGAPAGQSKHVINIGNVRLCVKHGNILFEPCNVVVNSINDEFNFNKGGVAKAFRKHCGEALLKMCDDKKKTMKNKGLAWTGAPGLDECDNILHLDLARYERKPEETIKECFNKIKDKLHREKSLVVAFPALGTGESGQKSPEEFAKDMVNSIREMKKSKNLSEVRVVVRGWRVFQCLVSAVTSLDPSVSRPATKTSKAAGSSAKMKTEMPLVYTQTEESVCMKGYSHDLTTAREAMSLYLFSDHEDCRQAAKEEIASHIAMLAGPVEKPGEGKKKSNEQTEPWTEICSNGMFIFWP